MIARNPYLKLAGYSLALGMPLLAPAGIAVEMPWLAPLIVFGIFPLLGLVVGEDRSLPVASMHRSPMLLAYLHWLPRIFALVWIAVLVWAVDYVERAELTAAGVAWLVVSVGIGSAVAICTAHELMHRRSSSDVRLGRLMASLCLYGHMYVEHMHHHAMVGHPDAGATAARGSSVYRFAWDDFLQGLRNASAVEAARLGRTGEPWWCNQLLQGYVLAASAALAVLAAFGGTALLFFIAQGIFAVYCFEAITYVHHYGLVRADGEEAGPQHAWAHHCWITNCLTFNNTFHSDHHLRPRTPYYELHAMHGAPHLPASYFTMFCVALVPPLWRRLMDPRLHALHEAQRSRRATPEWLRVDHCA